MAKVEQKMNLSSVRGAQAGNKYQFKIMTLISLHSHLEKHWYEVSTEIGQTKGGKFDDIAYEYDDDDNKTRRILMQTKHFINNNKKINDFSLFPKNDDVFMLTKYIHYYFENTLSTDMADGLCKLILFTNIDITAEAVEHNFINVSNDNFISKYICEDGSLYKLKDDQTYLTKLKHLVIKYHSEMKAKEYIMNIGQAKDIKLSSGLSPYRAHQAYLLSGVFQVNETNRITKIRRNLNDDVLIYFKENLEAHVKSHGFMQNIKKILLVDEHLMYSIDDFLDYIFESLVVKIPKLHSVSPELLTNEYIKEFANLFVLAVGQPNADKTDELIKKLLKGMEYCKNLQVETVNDQLYKLVEEWFLENVSLKREKQKGTEDMENLLKITQLLLKSQQYLNNIKSYGITFNDDCLATLSKDIDDSASNILHFILSHNHWITMLKLHQALESKGCEGYIFVDIKDIEADGKVLPRVKSVSGFVIECIQYGDEGELYNLMEEIVNMLNQYKVIFVTHDSVQKTSYRKIWDSFSFGHLSQISKDAILNNKLINLQGNLCSISELIECSRDIEDMLDDKAMTDLCSDKPITIGEKYDISKIPGAYYSMCNRHISISRFIELVSDLGNDYIFGVTSCDGSSSTKEQLLELCQYNSLIRNSIISGKIIIFQSYMDDAFVKECPFRITCHKLKNIVFSIQIKSGSLYLRQVYDPSFYIKREIKYDSRKYLRYKPLQKQEKDRLFHKPVDYYHTFDEKQFCDEINNRIVILSDDPGTGKTTTLKHMCCYLSKTKWIVRIDFRDTEVRNDLVKLSNSEIHKSNVFNFIINRSYLNLKSFVSKYLLYYFLWKNTGKQNKLMFVLDGFDEIPSNDHDTVMKMLDFLIWNSVCRIYLTTRRHYEVLLEHRYSVYCSRFIPLSYESLLRFFLKYLKIHLILTYNINNKFDLGIFATQVVDHWRSTFQRTIVVNPLFIRLISELHVDIIYNKGKDMGWKKVSCSSLVTRFIEEKFNTFIIEKKKHLSSKSSDWKMLYNNYYKIHTDISLKHIFPKYYDDIDCNITEEYFNDIMLLGILHWVNGQAEFEHRTFAEYFCVHYLLACLHRGCGSDGYEKAKSIVSELMFDAKSLVQNPTVLQEFLFSSVTSTNRLHKAIWSEDLYSFYQLIDEGNLPHEVDVLGYTALHYSIMCQKMDYFLTLIPHFQYAFHLNDITGRTILDYPRGMDTFFKYLFVKFPLQSLCENPRKDKESCHLLNIFHKSDEEGKVRLYSANDFNIILLICYGADCNLLDYTAACRIIKYSLHRLYESIYFYPFTVMKLFQCFDDLPIDSINADVQRTVILYIHDVERFFIFWPKNKERIVNRNFVFISINESYTSNFVEVSRFVGLMSENDYLTVLKYFSSVHLWTLPSEPYYFTCFLEDLSLYGCLDTFKYITEDLCKCRPLNNETILKCIISAIKGNHVYYVDYLWGKYQDLIIQIDGNTLLHLTAKDGFFSLLKHVCENSANINSQNRRGQTALHLAAERQWWDMVEYLRLQGGDMNIADKNNETPLDYIIKDAMKYNTDSRKPRRELGLLQYMHYLIIDIGATFNHGNFNKNDLWLIAQAVDYNINESTLLHYAVKNANVILVKFLLHMGVDPNIKDEYNKSALEYSETRCISTILLENGTHLHISLKDNNMTYANESLKKSSDESKLIPNFAEYISFTGDIPDNKTKTLFTYYYSFFNDYREFHDFSQFVSGITSDNEPSNNNRLYTFKKMNKSKDDPQISTFIAVWYNDCDLVFYLLKHMHWVYPTDVPQNGVDHLSFQNDEGNSLLHIAASCSNEEIIQYLLTHGVIYNSVNKLGKTPEQCLSYEDNYCKFGFIFRMINKLYSFVKQGNRHEVKNILVRFNCLSKPLFNEFINVRDTDGKSVLHHAVERDNVHVVRLLLLHGSDVNICDNSKKTPLHYINKNKSPDCMLELLKNGAIFDPKDKNGNTPYDLCENKETQEYLEHIECVFDCLASGDVNKAMLLMEKDTKLVSSIINTISRERNSLIVLAKCLGCESIIHFILRNGGCFEHLKRRNYYHGSHKNINVFIKIVDTLKCKPIYPTSFVYYMISRFQNEEDRKQNIQGVQHAPFPRRQEYFKYTQYFTFFDDLIMKSLANLTFSTGETLLHIVQDSHILNILIDYVNKDTIDTKDKKGRTALMASIFINVESLCINKVVMLCEKGANVNEQDIFGDTPLHMAVKKKDLTIVRHLLKNGAIFTLPNNYKKTALGIADGMVLKYLRKHNEHV